MHGHAEFAPLRYFRLRPHHQLHAVFNRRSQLINRHKATDARFLVFQVKKHPFALIYFEAGNLALNLNSAARKLQHLINQLDETANAEPWNRIFVHISLLLAGKIHSLAAAPSAAQLPGKAQSLQSTGRYLCLIKPRH